MGNQTTASAIPFIFRLNIWYGNIIISGVLGVVSVYLLIALLFHKLKVEKPNKDRFLKLSLENKFAFLSKYLCILIGIASFIRHWNSFGMMWFEFNAVFPSSAFRPDIDIDFTCNCLPRVGNIALTFGSGLVYLFLWFRQRVFYIHPSLKILNNRLVQVFSHIIMVVWFLYYISLYFFYFYLVQYRITKEGGCVVTDSSHDFYTSLIISWTAVSILMQIILLGLFIYPIFKRTLWRGSQNKGGNIRLMRRVHKAFVLTLICLFTDVLSVVMTKVFFVKHASSAIFPFSINLQINHLVTIACFDHWKRLLWPWKFKSRKGVPRRRKSEAVSSLSFSSTAHHVTSVAKASI